MLIRSLSLLPALLLLPGTAALAESSADLPPPSPKAVIGFHDSGINPYHEVFRTDDPWALEHPSTYIEGYPEDAVALPITLDEPEWAAAVQLDCELWRTVQPGQLYWFPGTRIVGAISFNPPVGNDANCSTLPGGGTEILDYNGHGTMVASRGASNEYGACLAVDCRVVSVQTPLSVPLLDPSASQPPTVNAIRWLADNSGWIDAQSNSWGPLVPGWEPTGEAGLVTANPELVREIERANTRHAAFWASGNGAAFRGGVLGHPTLLAAHFGISGYIVGGHDSGYMNTWPGFSPHIVADSCDAWAAVRNSTTDSGPRVAGGTSGATPFAAGGAAKVVLEARRILGDLDTGFGEDGVVASGPEGLVTTGPLADGVFTRDELRAVLLKTATARPGEQWEDGPICATGAYSPTPMKWTDVPAQYPEFIQIGYGAVDRVAQELAVGVLMGDSPLPDRTVTDQYFAVDDQARRALYPVWAIGS